MRAIEHLQLDPLVVIARAHDLILQSRVIDYHPDDWATLTYEQRKFFDWGGWLAVRPMEELPVLARDHAPGAGPAQLDRRSSASTPTRSPRCATCSPSGAR